jgi:hypothetical protein
MLRGLLHFKKFGHRFLLALSLSAACFADASMASEQPRNLPRSTGSHNPQKNANTNNNLNINFNTIQNTTNNAAASPVSNLDPPPSNWPLALEQKTTWMRPDAKTLRARIEASLTQPEYADPVVLRVLRKDPLVLFKQLANNELLSKLDAEDGAKQESPIFRSIQKRIQSDKLLIQPDDLDWLDLEKLANVIQTQTAVPEFSAFDWQQAISRASSAKSLAEHFQSDFERVKKVMNTHIQTHGVMSDVPFKNLLPTRAKSLYGKYSHLRGRNCFGTALEFATPRHVLNKVVNIETEEGHYRAMINSDEFARALWLGYSELSADEVLMGLNWGDVVVFYDASIPYSWQSLRHAVVHMGGDIYFHKQSKSAASPIELVTWKSLISLWQRITPTLDYKVFRKHPQNSGQSTFQKPTRAIEKLTWTR